MEKEMNEKKKQKNITKKAKKIRSIVMMSLLCVLMLSAATYAWFTLSKTAKVTNLTMTVGEATGLQIAPNAGTADIPTPGTYSGVLEFGDDGTIYGDPTAANKVYYNIIGKLKPANCQEVGTIKKPHYNADGEVDALNPITDTEVLTNSSSATSETEGYYYQTEFYLKTLGQNATKVVLNAGDLTAYTSGFVLSTPITATGTYVLSDDSDSDAKNKSVDYLGSRAIRISLTDDSGNCLIYEPNCDVKGKTGTQASYATGVAMSGLAATSAQSSTGVWKVFSDGAWIDGKQTTYLNVKTTDTLITMRIWIEGTDNECVNEISLDDLVAQLQFVEATTANCSSNDVKTAPSN